MGNKLLEDSQLVSPIVNLLKKLCTVNLSKKII